VYETPEFERVRSFDDSDLPVFSHFHLFCFFKWDSAFGSGYINDPILLKNYWGTLEHLLNTLLFCLGGVVWGRVIADPILEDSFGGRDWGYLILLFVLLTAIRFLLVAALYPILSRIGLKTNWQESVFLAYGGLRGAVGIALAIAIDNDVRRKTDDPDMLALTNKVFGFVGGIAF
jgi:NhaP-type Na+/H+ or K+/H+ antiporter